MPKNARETRSLQLAENLFARNSIEVFSDLNGTGDQVFWSPTRFLLVPASELDGGIRIEAANLEELRGLLLWV